MCNFKCQINILLSNLEKNEYHYKLWGWLLFICEMIYD